jgi:hypothetical protein
MSDSETEWLDCMINGRKAQIADWLYAELIHSGKLRIVGFKGTQAGEQCYLEMEMEMDEDVAREIFGDDQP